jgi:hypothetical protein
MIKKFTSRFLLFLLPALVIATLYSFVAQNPGGSPGGYAGSPSGSFQDCTHCHGGTAGTYTGVMNTNIPTEGYTAGTEYQITIAMSGTAKKGFELAAEGPVGQQLGTWGSSVGVKTVGSGKYATQSAASTANPTQWTIFWTAPPTGSGGVSFFGAFVNGYSNVSKKQITVYEKPNAISEINQLHLAVYPNPASRKLNISYRLNNPAEVSAVLLSLDGKDHHQLINETQNCGNHDQSVVLLENVTAGVYILELRAGKEISYQRVLIQ